MTTIHEALTQLADVPEADREGRRAELLDLAAQAVEAFAEREKLTIPPAMRSLIDRVDWLSLRACANEASALRTLLDAAGGSMSLPGAWLGLQSSVESLIKCCDVMNVQAQERVRGIPVQKSSVFVEAANETRAFGLWHGDVTLHSGVDLFVVSVYTDADGKHNGQVAHEMRRRFGVELPTEVLLRLSDGACTAYLPRKGATPAILVLSVPIEADWLDDDEWFRRCEGWVRGCFASLAALEVLGSSHEVVALPVLFGNRRLPIDAAMRLILRESANWLRRSRAGREIRFTVFYGSELPQWLGAMDVMLGRTAIHEHEDAEIDLHRKQLLAWHSGAAAREREIVDDLVEALRNADSLLPGPICNGARKAGEAMAMEWIKSFGIAGSFTKLNAMIEVLQKPAPPLVCAWLHTLRLLGNAFSHHESSMSDAAQSHRYVAEVLRATRGLLELRSQLAAVQKGAANG